MKPHIIHFIILLAILGIGVAMFFYESGNQLTQLAVGIVSSIAYVTWGIIHHTLQQDLHRKVVVEYVLIGVIAVILLMIVLLP